MRDLMLRRSAMTNTHKKGQISLVNGTYYDGKVVVTNGTHAEYTNLAEWATMSTPLTREINIQPGDVLALRLDASVSSLTYGIGVVKNGANIYFVNDKVFSSMWYYYTADSSFGLASIFVRRRIGGIVSFSADISLKINEEVVF